MAGEHGGHAQTRADARAKKRAGRLLPLPRTGPRRAGSGNAPTSFFLQINKTQDRLRPARRTGARRKACRRRPPPRPRENDGASRPERPQASALWRMAPAGQTFQQLPHSSQREPSIRYGSPGTMALNVHTSAQASVMVRPAPGKANTFQLVVPLFAGVVEIVHFAPGLVEHKNAGRARQGRKGCGCVRYERIIRIKCLTSN